MDALRRLMGQRRSRAWFLGTLGVIATVAWLWLPDERTDARAPRQNGQPIAVDVIEVKQADVPVYLEGLGTIQAFNTVTVTARVDGQLQKLGFEEGQMV